MRKLFIGPCPLCGITIWEYKDEVVDGIKRKILVQNEHGTHFWIRSNYNTVAKFAICKNCLNTLNMAKVAQVIDAQVFTWLWDMHTYKREQFNKYRFYVAIDWADNEKEVLEKCRQASS